MKTRSVTLLFLAMLGAHIGHVFEEVWGRFRPMETVFGTGGFLAVNWVLILIPLTIFYFLLSKRKWAYIFGMIYAVLMTLNGIAHIAGLLITGEYFGGFAGSFSGIVLLVLGPLLYASLKEEGRTIMLRGKRPGSGPEPQKPRED